MKQKLTVKITSRTGHPLYERQATTKHEALAIRNLAYIHKMRATIEVQK